MHVYDWNSSEEFCPLSFVYLTIYLHQYFIWGYTQYHHPFLAGCACFPLT